MGFFDAVLRPDPPPDPSPREPWMGPPHGVLPGSVASGVLLGVSETVAVGLGSLLVWPTGLQLTLWMVAREENVHVDPHGCMHQPGAEASEVWPPPDALRFGVQFSDGRKATNFARLGDVPADGPTGPWLLPIGGGGGGGTFRYDYWLWPLPPPPVLTFACEWPAWNLPETQTELDTAPVHEAAARSRDIWT